jgi:hypothetical protein
MKRTFCLRPSTTSTTAAAPASIFRHNSASSNASFSRVCPTRTTTTHRQSITTLRQLHPNVRSISSPLYGKMLSSEVTNEMPASPATSLWRRALMTTAAAVAQDNHPLYRIERDTFGEIKVPADKYWGAQTQRCTTCYSSFFFPGFYILLKNHIILFYFRIIKCCKNTKSNIYL